MEIRQDQEIVLILNRNMVDIIALVMMKKQNIVQVDKYFTILLPVNVNHLLVNIFW